MKFFLAILILGLVTVAYCQDEQNTAPLSKDEVLNLIKGFNPAVTCINWECRTNCQAEGNKAGYCSLGVCNCVAPLVFAK